MAKRAKRTGVSNADADELLEWALEYGVQPALDHRGTRHWLEATTSGSAQSTTFR